MVERIRVAWTTRFCASASVTASRPQLLHP